MRPVGANREVSVDVRLLSATHRDLAREVAAGSFRQDLFYRINVIELRVPPLRDRGDDILSLSAVFLANHAHELGVDALHLSEEAEAALLAYTFPGNVRELENILERAVALSEGSELRAADLRLPTTRGSNPLAAASALDSRHDGDGGESTRAGTRPMSQPAHAGSEAVASTEFPAHRGDVRQAVRLPDVLLPRDGAGQAPGAASNTGPVPTGPADLEVYLGNIERDLILKTLQETKYNRTKAAEKLGITFRALRYKLKKLGIE